MHCTYSLVWCGHTHAIQDRTACLHASNLSALFPAASCICIYSCPCTAVYVADSELTVTAALTIALTYWPAAACFAQSRLETSHCCCTYTHTYIHRAGVSTQAVPLQPIRWHVPGWPSAATTSTVYDWQGRQHDQFCIVASRG